MEINMTGALTESAPSLSVVTRGVSVSPLPRRACVFLRRVELPPSVGEDNGKHRHAAATSSGFFVFLKPRRLDGDTDVLSLQIQ